MILIIGGYASGKRSYARQTLGYRDADMADACLDGRPVVYNAQDMAGTADDEALADALAAKEAVILNEVGGGVIPMTRRERDQRDASGRLAILLAARASRVVRIVCGLPMVIKGAAEGPQGNA